MKKLSSNLFALTVVVTAALPAWADVAPGPACGCSATEALSGAGPYGAGLFAALVGLAIVALPKSRRRG